MPKQYVQIPEWVDGSVAVPVNAQNLNNMDSGIDLNDTRIAALEDGGPPLVAPSNKTANYTLADSDHGKTITMEVATANSLFVPENSVVPIRIGVWVNVLWRGAGVTTIVPATGVTIYREDTGATLSAAGVAINNRRGIVAIWKQAVNTWYISGNMAA